MVQKENFSSRVNGSFAKEISLTQGKIPPNAVDLEKLVIGSFLIDKKGLDTSIELLKSEIFYDPRHQVIFEAIAQLYLKNEPVDMMMVINELRKEEKLSLAGGDQYIIDLSLSVSSSAHIESYVRIVMEKYILRSLIEVSNDVIDNSYKDSADVFQLLDKAEQEFFNITNGTIKKGFDTAGALVKQAIKNIEALKDKKGLSGVPSGFSALDKETGGWQNSDLTIVAGRPGMGKTAFLVQQVVDLAIQNMAVGIFSLEMSAEQIAVRIITNYTKIPNSSILRKGLKEDERERYYHYKEDLTKLKIHIDDTPSISIQDLKVKAKMMKLKYNIKALFVDYLQLATYEKSQNREQEIAKISSGLKAIAKELNIPVIALS